MKYIQNQRLKEYFVLCRYIGLSRRASGPKDGVSYICDTGTTFVRIQQTSRASAPGLLAGKRVFPSRCLKTPSMIGCAGVMCTFLGTKPKSAARPTPELGTVLPPSAASRASCGFPSRQKRAAPAPRRLHRQRPAACRAAESTGTGRSHRSSTAAGAPSRLPLERSRSLVATGVAASACGHGRCCVCAALDGRCVRYSGREGESTGF
jgi:hypothetical protein